MKTGRNEPCPCGSGKKFKKCCGIGGLTEIASTQVMLDTDGDAPELEQMFGCTEGGEVACMATLVHSAADSENLKMKHGIEAKLGQWIVSSGTCEQMQIQGPFTAMDAALDFGRDHYDVIRWTSTPTHF